METGQVKRSEQSPEAEIMESVQNLTLNDKESLASNGLNILDLPWEDVLVTRVLPLLEIRDLFRLRQVCTGFRDVVAMHFKERRHLDLSEIGHVLNAEAFMVMSSASSCLQTLNLSNCKQWITDVILIPVIERNRNLRDIDLSGDSNLSTEVVRTISVRCPELRSLSLAECQRVTSTTMESVAMKCMNVEHLDLTGCWEMDDDTINLFVQLHPQLKWLSVARAYGITKMVVDVICQFCPDIEYLDVQGCWRIMDPAICKLGSVCKNLKTLKVKDCRYITERSLAGLRCSGVKIDIPLPEESDLAKLERHLRAREFARARSIPPNFVL